MFTPALPPELSAVPVDVFIATCDEAPDNLERTLIGARAIEHADLRVWVLDDGGRDWAQALAREHGAHYVRRANGCDGRAGAVENGLRTALAAGRRPDYVLLLDACSGAPAVLQVDAL